MYQARSQLKRNSFWFSFGKYSLRISTVTPSTLSDIFLSSLSARRQMTGHYAQ